MNDNIWGLQADQTLPKENWIVSPPVESGELCDL